MPSSINKIDFFLNDFLRQLPVVTHYDIVLSELKHLTEASYEKHCFLVSFVVFFGRVGFKPFFILFFFSFSPNYIFVRLLSKYRTFNKRKKNIRVPILKLVGLTTGNNFLFKNR